MKFLLLLLLLLSKYSASNFSDVVQNNWPPPLQPNVDLTDEDSSTPHTRRTRESGGVWSSVSGWFSNLKAKIFGDGASTTAAPSSSIEGSGMEESNSPNRVSPTSRGSSFTLYKNGLISQYRSILCANQRLPRSQGNEVMALDHALAHGHNVYKKDFVAFWRGSRVVWGVASLDDSTGNFNTFFVLNGSVHNDSAVLANTRILETPDETRDNFRYTWQVPKTADLTNVVTVESNKCTQFAPAVYIDKVHQYEFLGEADLINKVFTYYAENGIHQITGSNFNSAIRLMMKTRCRCACDVING